MFETDSLVKNKSKFCSPKNCNRNLEAVIEFSHNQNKTLKTNLIFQSNKAKMTYFKLKKEKGHKLREAYKGGTVVTINNKHYLKISTI